MSELIVIGYDTESKAEEARKDLQKMSKGYLVEVAHAAASRPRDVTRHFTQTLRAVCLASSLCLAAPMAFAQSAIDIQQQVESMLDAELQAPNYLNVTVRDGGRVVLQGKLYSSEEVTRIKKKVKGVDGVSEVTTEVQVP